MHTTAIENAKRFFAVYMNAKDAVVVDIGAQDVNGSLKQVVPKTLKYIGVDFVAGKGVDIILDDPYTLPFESSSIDCIVCSSCFEHSEMFWITFLEILRVLKPTGLLYLNVPSNGPFHRYPVDCWRFYPDSGRALVAWAKRNGISAALLESYTSRQGDGLWNDFVAVFIKDENNAALYPERITKTLSNIKNVFRLGENQISNFVELPQDTIRSHPLMACEIYFYKFTSYIKYQLLKK